MKYILDWIYGEDKKECCECEKGDCKCDSLGFLHIP